MTLKGKRFLPRDRSLQKQVEAIKRARLASDKVVKLQDFRDLKSKSRPETILVVDDDEVIRNGLTRILEGEGYRVLVAQDGMELSKVLESVVMDLILLDVNLPWVDGFELCSLIRRHELFKELPLILISASTTEEDVRKGFASGCSDYVGKPFNIEKLLASVEGVLASRQIEV